MLKPMGDRLLVKTAKREEQTKSGIYLPIGIEERTREGEVMAVGVVDNIKVGDIVVFVKYAGTNIQDENEDLIILRESDILAIKGEN